MGGLARAAIWMGLGGLASADAGLDDAERHLAARD